MMEQGEARVFFEKTNFRLSDRVQKLLYAFVVIGVVGFVIGLFTRSSYLAWQALLVNTLFFGGLAMGGLAFAVIFTITNARWARPIKRLAEALAVFIPLAAILYVILFFGAHRLFEWANPGRVIAAKAGWLNMPFFVIRNLIALALITLAAVFYLKFSTRPDLGLTTGPDRQANRIAQWISKNYTGHEQEQARTEKKTRILAPILAILFFLVSTLIAFDWIMSIDQEWYSTMFGAQYAVSNLIGAAAALLIIAGFVRGRFGLQDYISINRYHDLARLTFALCALWAYLVFAQVLVIWYGNLPEETPFLVMRMESLEWGWVSWLLFILMAIIPFFGLLSRRACRSIWFSRLIAVDILVGVWLEKYFLVVPSIQENNARAGIINATKGLPGFSLNLYDVSITLGVGAIFLITYVWFLGRVPVLPVADPLLSKEEELPEQ